MGMSVGGGGGVKAEINVTPLVDVMLVLLIIFMVVTPLMQMGYTATVPPEVKTQVPTPATDQLILRLDDDGRIYINKDVVSESEFDRRVRELTKGRESKLVFFAADGKIQYERVMQFMDRCRAAGATNLGIVLDDLAH
jgi:biopolymer transport protein ExbD